MPAFVRFLAGAFLVFPGAAMWLSGIAILLGYSSALPRMILHTADRRDSLAVYIVFAGVAVILMVFGYAMVASFDLLTAKRRYDFPGKHVLSCIGIELLAQVLVVIGFAVAASALLVFWDLDGARPLSAAFLFLAGFAGCTVAIWLYKQTLLLRERWKAAHAASLPLEMPAE